MRSGVHNCSVAVNPSMSQFRRPRFSPGRRVLTSIWRAEQIERLPDPLGRKLGQGVRNRLARRWGVFVHRSARIGDIWLPHPVGIVIGAGCLIEDGVIIYQNVTLGRTDEARLGYPVCRKGVRLFAGSVVLGDVELGENAVVGANSVVLSDVAAGSVVVGAPARARQREPRELS